MDALLTGDTFLIEQLVRPVVNLYKVSAAGQPVAFCRQKRMALKEDIRFFADESEASELFRIKARAVLEIGGRYDVTTPAGEPIGVLEKVFGKSLLRSTWRVLDPDGQEVAGAQEANMAIALVRRLIDLPIPYHFTITAGEAQIGELRREFSFRDRYTLDLSRDAERRLDRRLAVALAIALDALQGR